MEIIMRIIGNVFLYVADAIHEAKNRFDGYIFGILFEGIMNSEPTLWQAKRKMKR